MPEYLTDKIEQARRTERPRYGMLASGYTCKRGGPSSIQVRLAGESRWRRLYVWQFSNAGTAFIRKQGQELIVREHMLPKIEGE